jgi:histidinol-phosphatase
MVCMGYERELALAVSAAKKAGELQLNGRLSASDIQCKPDDSPVTIIDIACEQQIRAMLSAEFPADGFLGEESAAEAGISGRRWIVDPLDGTRPYIRGIPTYSALIALEDNGRPVVGVIHLPALGQTYTAAAGAGAFCNGAPIRVSTTARIGEVMGGALGFVEKADTAAGRSLLNLMRRWDYAYGFMDAYSYGCVAAGRLDACVNLLDKPWDCAAAACIVVEAGGRFSDIDGNETIHNGSIILSNGHLHDRLLEHFKYNTL